MLVAWKPSRTADEFRRLFCFGRVSHGDVEKRLIQSRRSGSCCVQGLARQDGVTRVVQGVEPDLIRVHLTGVPGMKAWLVIGGVMADYRGEQTAWFVEPPQTRSPHLGSLSEAKAILFEHVVQDQKGVDGEADADFDHGQNAAGIPDLGDLLHDVKCDRFVFDLFHGVPGVHGAHAWVGGIQNFFAFEKAVGHDGCHVLRGGSEGQRVLFWDPLAQIAVEEAAFQTFDRIDVDALGPQSVIELVVDDAVLAFLADEVFDFLLEFWVCDLIPEVTNAIDEEAFAFGEHGGHGVEKTGLEGVASKPEFGDVALEIEVQLGSGHDALFVMHGVHPHA